MSDERRRISQADFEAQFFPGSQRLAPGFWVDRDGGLHASVPELLALVHLEDTEANREAVAQMIEEMFRTAAPGATVIRHDP